MCAGPQEMLAGSDGSGTLLKVTVQVRRAPADFPAATSSCEPSADSAQRGYSLDGLDGHDADPSRVWPWLGNVWWTLQGCG